jgi:hypothetical protein
MLRLAPTAQACCLLGSLLQQANAAALTVVTAAQHVVLQASRWTAMTLLVKAVVVLLQVVLMTQGCSSCWQQQGMACSHVSSSSSGVGPTSSSSSACLARCGQPAALLMQLQRMVALPLLLLLQPTGTKPSLSSYDSLRSSCPAARQRQLPQAQAHVVCQVVGASRGASSRSKACSRQALAVLWRVAHHLLQLQ